MRLLDAAALAGIADATLAMAVEYAKTREQFGRPIGSFQAVKQRLAEMLVLVESARSAALAAVTAAATDDPELEHVAAVAALTCGEAYTWVTAQTVQLHGGIGFTWEHDAHLYFKRAAGGHRAVAAVSAGRGRETIGACPGTPIFSISGTRRWAVPPVAIRLPGGRLGCRQTWTRAACCPGRPWPRSRQR